MKGPKGKFTKERAQIICESIRNGLSKEAACARAGIDRKTLYNWLENGRAAKRGRYADFYQAFRDAEAQFEALATRAVRDGMMGGFFQVPMFDADHKLIPQVDPNRCAAPRFARSPAIQDGIVVPGARPRPRAEGPGPAQPARLG